MILVVQARINRQHVHEEPLDFPVGRPAFQNPVPLENTPGVGIDHEDGFPTGIEQDAVGGLFPDSRNRQQPPARFAKIPGEHPGQVSPEISAQYRKKGFKPPGLDPVAPRRPNHLLQVFVDDTVQNGRLKGPLSLDAPDGLLHIRPIRVLRQDCPYGHFEGRIPRPPVKRPKAPVQGPVHADQWVPRLQRTVSLYGPYSFRIAT